MVTPTSCNNHCGERNQNTKEAGGEPTNDNANKGKQVEGGGVYTRVKLYAPSKRTTTECCEERRLQIGKRGSKEEGWSQPRVWVEKMGET
ncbi:hypothetical protein DVH24_016805 [Malus domestica]|uniref:Uncharacterized protein n=1 Tax=Malus domestica TaxID=3750 RepID=A0A498HYI8_MALDO|nr:hypothetical protein DVH24_016805 [Malus domestica]